MRAQTPLPGPGLDNTAEKAGTQGCLPGPATEVMDSIATFVDTVIDATEANRPARVG
jgi:hypothetical protein